MFAEKVREDEELRRKRLNDFLETQVWQKDIKPFLLEKLEVARHGIRHEREDIGLHWQCVSAEALIEDFFQYMTGFERQELWEPPRQENPEPEIKKASLLKRLTSRWQPGT